MCPPPHCRSNQSPHDLSHLNHALLAVARGKRPPRARTIGAHARDRAEILTPLQVYHLLPHGRYSAPHPAVAVPVVDVADAHRGHPHVCDHVHAHNRAQTEAPRQ